MSKAPGKPVDPKKLASAKYKAEQNVKFALRKLEMYKALAKQDAETTQKMAGEIFLHLKTIKKISDTVAFAEYLVGLKNAVMKIGKGAVTSMKASGKVVRDAHKEMIDGGLDIAKDHVLDDVKEFGGANQEDDSVIISTLSKAISLLDQWTSPTWWFYALLRKYEGVPWSETLTEEIGGELKNNIKKLMSESRKRIEIYKTCGAKSQKAMERWVIARHALNQKLGAQKKAA